MKAQHAAIADKLHAQHYDFLSLYTVSNDLCLLTIAVSADGC